MCRNVFAPLSGGTSTRERRHASRQYLQRVLGRWQLLSQYAFNAAADIYQPGGTAAWTHVNLAPPVHRAQPGQRRRNRRLQRHRVGHLARTPVSLVGGTRRAIRTPPTSGTSATAAQRSRQCPAPRPAPKSRGAARVRLFSLLPIRRRLRSDADRARQRRQQSERQPTRSRSTARRHRLLSRRPLLRQPRRRGSGATRLGHRPRPDLPGAGTPASTTAANAPVPGPVASPAPCRARWRRPLSKGLVVQLLGQPAGGRPLRSAARRVDRAPSRPAPAARDGPARRHTPAGGGRQSDPDHDQGRPRRHQDPVRQSHRRSPAPPGQGLADAAPEPAQPRGGTTTVLSSSLCAERARS